MLDAATKRRIDDARDILVGKVPDPKSQVEQITIALIYKFMDDLDAEAEEWGGKRHFFADDFQKFGWAQLMNASLSGFERWERYSDGIDTMQTNPAIPQLFRDIFKNAFVPYRDPETLRLFLRTIGEFTYDHSERLGDAFEYLLSIMGAQGDAGQFRTPRHIIDFIVAILDPQKDETILDPACGTAGFLISAYKHILAANKNADGQNTLTPDDQARLTRNISGYDISPDMVRLSLANMYLHEFTKPDIREYDTLTSEENWGKRADVILANPPFMSPKGGIKPHSRFSITSKRSEVLFVDYIAEHLTAGGRAGIIVPEGIIFQSQTAYKQLRKLLVEESLVAVISLPAGVFNPYSGVKTSILILDRTLAKTAESIAFFKVEHDGFSLGAQRRPTAQSDLPAVTAEIGAYLHALRAGEPLDALSLPHGQIVAKAQIAENGEYNLSGERYRENATKQTAFPLVPLGQIAAEIKAGFASGQSSTGEDGVPHIRPMNITIDGQFTWDGLKRISTDEFNGRDNYILKSGDVLFNNTNSKELIGKTCLIKEEILGGFSNHMTRIRVDSVTYDAHFLAAILHHAWRNGRFSALANKWIGQAGINAKALAEFEIPLPPLDVQREIVAEIEGYQRVVDGARAVVENYRPTLPTSSDWPLVELNELCVIRSGGTPNRANDAFWGGDIPWVTTTLINFGSIDHANEFITEEGMSNSSTWIVPKGTVLMAMYGQGVTRGRVATLAIDAAINQACAAFQVRNGSLTSDYLFYALQSQYDNLRRISEARGGNQSNLSAQMLKEYAIELPPVPAQEQIVSDLEAERKLVDANRELIGRFERKIQATLNRVWGG